MLSYSSENDGCRIMAALNVGVWQSIIIKIIIVVVVVVVVIYKV
jgi:hypothetical protein